VCGERRVAEQDLSLGRFLRNVLATFTSLDTRGARSLGLLLSRPGLLTAAYVAGRRKRYLSPLQLFLIANLLFYLAAAFLPVVTLDTPLNAHLYGSPYSELARDMVRGRFASQDSVDFPRFETRFNFAAEQYAKSLFIVLVPFFALAVALLRVGRREPAGKHIAFALHLLAFQLLLGILVSAVILLVRSASEGRLLGGSSIVIPLGVVTLLMLYLVPAFRTAYGSRWLTAVVQAVIVAALFVPAILLYRFILFLVVFFST
jgi:hypothetical protein